MYGPHAHTYGHSTLFFSFFLVFGTSQRVLGSLQALIEHDGFIDGRTARLTNWDGEADRLRDSVQLYCSTASAQRKKMKEKIDEWMDGVSRRAKLQLEAGPSRSTCLRYGDDVRALSVHIHMYINSVSFHRSE